MDRIWKILPKIEEAHAKKFPEYDQTILQLLYNRGITGKDAIERFLNASYEKDSLDPFLFNDMEQAVGLIVKHIKAGNKIYVYGDYDADGITASAVLYETLSILKADTGIYIPYRITEGYGLNEKAINELAENNCRLLITVDTGIRNKSYVEYAKSRGMEVVVTDHHPAPPKKEDLPDCPVLNPILKDEKYPYAYLAGVGVSFKLAMALVRKTKLSEEDKLKLEERVLDLVAIGTVADCVQLTGENRVLVKKGLEILNKDKRAGLRELKSIAQLDNGKELDSWNIGFQLAPRLNAAGRLDHANIAFKLLITKDKAEAAALSRSLNENNSLRQNITEEIVNEIEEQIKDKLEGKKIIVAVSPRLGSGEQWNEGVVGLVAGRICEKYYLPTIVITSGENIIKGSGRSIAGYNLIKAVEQCGDLLSKYGGHPAACGIALVKENLAAFIGKIEEIAERELAGVELKPRTTIDMEIGLQDVTEELCEEAAKFAPFGNSNDRLVFVSRNISIVDIITMGSDNQHIKFRIKNEESNIKTALAFGKAENWGHFEIGQKIDMVYHIEMNGYNGRREVQLKIVDIKEHEDK